jgi:membrane protease YdiL (CAAX protease family)
MTKPQAPGGTASVGPGLALLSYLVLLVGFATIGFSTQPREPVLGLWVTEGLAIALPALVALRGANVRPGPYLGLAAPTAGAVLLAVGLAFLNQPVVALLEFWAQRLLPQNWVQLFEQKNAVLEALFAGRKLAMVLTVTIAAPIGEELFFRGFALPAFAKRVGMPAAVVITGALFALIHLDPVGFIGLWELGILFGLLRHVSGSLWPSVVCHAANNGMAAAAFLLGWQKPDEVPPSWLLWLGAALLAAGAPLALRRLARPGPAPAREERWIDDARPGFSLGRAGAMVAIWLAAVGLGGVSLLRQLFR